MKVFDKPVTISYSLSSEGDGDILTLDSFSNIKRSMFD